MSAMPEPANKWTCWLVGEGALRAGLNLYLVFGGLSNSLGLQVFVASPAEREIRVSGSAGAVLLETGHDYLFKTLKNFT
jgi:hypothetical protein